MKSCGHCINRKDCPARTEIENGFMTKFSFLDRLLMSPDFWDRLAELCSKYKRQYTIPGEGL